MKDGFKRGKRGFEDYENGNTTLEATDSIPMDCSFRRLSLSPRPGKKIKMVHEPSEEKTEALSEQQGKKLYSYREIYMLVGQLLEKKQSVLSEEYENLLNQGYREQFNQFTKFNQDHILSQIKQGELSYLM